MKNLQKSAISQIRNWSRTFLEVQYSKAALIFVLGFPTGQDSAKGQADNGTSSKSSHGPGLARAAF